VRTDPLLARIAAFIATHDAPAPGERVLAMFSGGPDSLCLLHALAEARPGAVGVVTFDHGLRPEAAAETRAVAAIAASLGVPCTTMRLALDAGPGIQERARTARYAAARDLAAREGWDVIATGHTASDQAETVVMRIARGTGRAGALGMAPRAGDLVRPLLGVTADETAAWCAGAGLDAAADPSNRDRAYTRVRARGLVAGLEDLHPGAGRNIVRFADLLRDEQSVLEEVVAAAWGRCARDGGLVVAALSREPLAVRRLLVRYLLASAGIAGAAVGAATLDGVLATMAGAPRRDIPAGAAVRAGGVLHVLAATPPAPDGASLPVPGRVRFGDVEVWSRAGAAEAPERWRVAIPPGADIAVRGPRAGDRIALPGGGHARVGRILRSDGVPAPLRTRVPVIVVDEVPVWVAGHRVAAGALAVPGEPAIVLEVVPA
jgi:tRNA(Ile)-lysidine synthase